jgi:type IV secretory pathway protease TraF
MTAGGISVNGTLLRNTAPLEYDTMGRLLSHWPYGRYIVAKGTIWVASSYNPRSFDCRYFGPIKTYQSGATYRSGGTKLNLNGH